MRIIKYISSFALAALLLTSCREELCPAPFCMMDITINVDALLGAKQNAPIEVADIFLRNEDTGSLTAVHMNLNDAMVSSKEVDGVTVYTYKLSQAMPYGSYTMWLWGNVKRSDVYSYDRFSINMKDQYIGADYILGKADAIDIDSRKMALTLDLVRVTANIKVTISAPIDKGISLIVSDVFTNVDANGVFGGTNNVLVFEHGSESEGLFPNVPPAQFFTFITSSQSSPLDLTFESGNNDRRISTIDQSFMSGEFYELIFDTKVQLD